MPIILLIHYACKLQMHGWQVKVVGGSDHLNILAKIYLLMGIETFYFTQEVLFQYSVYF